MVRTFEDDAVEFVDDVYREIEKFTGRQRSIKN